MKSMITLTDKVTAETVEDLRGASDTLADLITKAENFAIDGEVEHLSVELKVDPQGDYQCAHRRGFHEHTQQCEQERKPARTYAQLVVKVSSNG